MHPITGTCHPSSSGLLGNLEEKMTKNLDKFGERVRKKLLPKEKGHIFVPSSSASNGVSEGSLTRSTSQIEQPVNLLYANTIDQRRQSSPAAPMQKGPALMPHPKLAPPPPIGFFNSLTIDTGGGECAGSGFGYLNFDIDSQVTEEDNNYYIEAQNLALTMVKKAYERRKEMLRKVKDDNQMINDYIATAYKQQLESPERRNIDILEEKIRQLRDELNNLRAMSPRVPPERPPRPNASSNHPNSWSCLQCATTSPNYEYHCKCCKFPRLDIDPNEAVICICEVCQKAVGGRLFVSVAPEGDWEMVNMVNPIKKQM